MGGLGISGGSPDEDQKICEDVLRSAGFDLDFPEWAGTAFPAAALSSLFRDGGCDG